MEERATFWIAAGYSAQTGVDVARQPIPVLPVSPGGSTLTPKKPRKMRGSLWGSKNGAYLPVLAVPGSVLSWLDGAIDPLLVPPLLVGFVFVPVVIDE